MKRKTIEEKYIRAISLLVSKEWVYLFHNVNNLEEYKIQNQKLFDDYKRIIEAIKNDK
jgi:hypothetical protein